MKLVGVAHVSNVLGTINPVAEIAARARAAGALTLVDGSQAVPQMPVDLGELGADFYAWTGHKALGPTGVGVLHGRRELLEAMPPFLGGGDMIATVAFEGSILERAAVQVRGRHLAGRRGHRPRRRDRLPRRDRHGAHPRAREGPDRLRPGAPGRGRGLRIFGPLDPERRGGVVSFAMDGIHPHDVAELCDREAVCIRAGHHCAQPLMRRMDVPATARASFHVYNAREDVDRLIDALKGAREVFGI